jgi:hypothetical protein
MHVLLALAALALPALGSAVGVGSVHVRIELQGHATQCYIAAVPVEKPNAQPQREDIVDAQAVNWDLPAGRYRILAGAIDHATATSRLITVVPGDTVGSH